MWASSKDFAHGVSFACTWEIGISSKDVREFGPVIYKPGGVSSIVDAWSIGAATSLTGPCSWTQASAVWHVIFTHGHPLVSDMDVPDNAITG